MRIFQLIEFHINLHYYYTRHVYIVYQNKKQYQTKRRRYISSFSNFGNMLQEESSDCRIYLDILWWLLIHILLHICYIAMVIISSIKFSQTWCTKENKFNYQKLLPRKLLRYIQYILWSQMLS